MKQHILKAGGRAAALRKLRSRRGASLLIALLLFLACAALGGVILAAGTAAQGRVSGMVTADRQYYSAASAAELLARELDGKTVTVVQTRMVASAQPYAGLERTPSGAPTVTAGYRIEIYEGTPENGARLYAGLPEDGSPFPADTLPFLASEAAFWMFADGTDWQADAISDPVGSSRSGGFSMRHSTEAGGVDGAELEIGGTAALLANGDVVFTREDRIPVSEGDYHYAVRLCLQAGISRTESVSTDYDYGPPQYLNGAYTGTDTTTVTTVRRTEFVWKAVNAQGGVSP